MAVTSVPIRTNPKIRESRLFQSIPAFLGRSITTMIRTYAMYQPLRVFFYIGAVVTIVGLIPVIRFVYFYLIGDGAGHIQSLILGGVLLVIGFVTLLIGLVADLISFNRQLVEMILERVRRLDLDQRRDKQRRP